MDIKNRIINTACLLLNNPNIFLKKLIVKIKKLKPLPIKPVQKRINGVLFEFDFTQDPEVKNMYIGGYEVEVVEVMKKILRKGDVFIDVGANIGYLSCIGAGFVGKTGQVHSFEPVPEYFNHLRKIATMNPAYKIVANQCALGEYQGVVPIKVSNFDIGLNTMVSGLMNNASEVKEIVRVSVGRLDDYINEESLKNISLIKIDVEGYEFSVLKGLRNWFKNVKYLPAIICEIKPAAYPFMEYTLAQLLEYMQTFKYRAYSLTSTHTEICISKLERTTNVVFVSTRQC